MQRIISIKLPERLLERLDAYASRRGMARSEAIREAILTLLAYEGVLAQPPEEEDRNPLQWGW